MNVDLPGMQFQDAQAITDQVALAQVPHDQLLLAVCHEGAACLAVGTRLFVVEKNDLVLIPAGETYLLQSAPANIAIWSILRLNPDAILGDNVPDAARLDPACLRGPHVPHVLKSAEHAGIVTLVSQMIADLRLQGAHKSPQQAQLIRKLIAQLKRLPMSSPGTDPSPSASYMPAVAVMFKDYRSTCDEDGLATSCQQSLGQFRKNFTEIYGCDASEYIKRIQIFHAAAYMRFQTCDVTGAMQQVGWSDPEQFEAAFQRLIGSSTKQWRKISN